jgi:hypothetical protein
VEYELANNGKWQRGYPPFLSNWLNNGYQAARLMASMTAAQGGAPDAGHAEEADFGECIELWGWDSDDQYSAAQYTWERLKGHFRRLPTLADARQGRARFPSMEKWLVSLGEAWGIAGRTRRMEVGSA